MNNKRIRQASLVDEPFIPTKAGLIGLKEALAPGAVHQISSTRDDMELGGLRLAICAAQVMIRINSESERLHLIENGLSEQEYDRLARPYRDKFALNYGPNRFMQAKIDAKAEPKPIQKLLPGMPEGNNPALFNKPAEFEHICLGCVAVALHNQATGTPSFGGGYKGPIHGGAPITTFMAGETLRETIFSNILIQPVLDDLYGDRPTDEFNWIDPIVAGSTTAAASIGINRALFFQPAKIELCQVDLPPGTKCQLCGFEHDIHFDSFRSEKFSYTVLGLFDYPHTPQYWLTKKGKIEAKSLHFTTPQPSWTMLTKMLFHREADKTTIEPAPVVKHRPRYSGAKMNLLVGGYRNNQSLVIERRHHIFNLPEEWGDLQDDICFVIDTALSINSVLNRKLFQLAKQLGFNTDNASLHTKGVATYLRLATPIIETYLSEAGRFEDKYEHQEATIKKLIVLARKVFVDIGSNQTGRSPQNMKKYILVKASFDKNIRDANPFQ